MGPVRCTRVFTEVLTGNSIRLEARGEFGAFQSGKADCKDSSFIGGRGHEEVALIGRGGERSVSFWSCTSDGKRSQGVVSDVSDSHPEAIGFEAEMDAGIARMAYGPDGEGAFYWVVESKTAKGWRRFTNHHHRRDGTKGVGHP